MKKLSMLIFLISFSAAVPQTLMIEDNLDYPAGTLTAVCPDWIENPTGSTDIQVVNGSLVYPGYYISAAGGRIQLDGGASGRSGATRSFTEQSANGSKIYISFMMKVISTEDMDLPDSGGDRFCNLKTAGSSATRACIFVRQGSAATKFQIGLGKLTTPVWHPGELDVDSTYLVIAAYIFQSGSDVVKLWINPVLDGVEPAAGVEQTTGTDAATLGEIQFRQGLNSGDMEIDGLRIADSWVQAPLPVELVSFNAVISGNSVILKWATATEVNNYGFEVERGQKSEVKSQIRDWEKIGFIAGNGNSNSPNLYTFSDLQVKPGIYYYRLRQIDTDGSFEYSNEISVNINELPAVFSLDQNYPNPFNPVTTLSFVIGQSSLVSLVIYDILGNEVAVLLNEEKPAGEYKMEFSAEGLPSGIYFYKLKSEGNTIVKKMVYLK